MARPASWPEAEIRSATRGCARAGPNRDARSLVHSGHRAPSHALLRRCAPERTRREPRGWWPPTTRPRCVQKSRSVLAASTTLYWVSDILAKMSILLERHRAELHPASGLLLPLMAGV